MVPGLRTLRAIPTPRRSVPFLQKKGAKEQNDFDEARQQHFLGDSGKRKKPAKERSQPSGASDAQKLLCGIHHFVSFEAGESSLQKLVSRNSDLRQLIPDVAHAGAVPGMMGT